MPSDAFNWHQQLAIAMKGLADGDRRKLGAHLPCLNRLI